MIKILAIVGDFFPPCSGSSERIWNIMIELVRLKCNVVLTAHIWKPFKVEHRSVEVIPSPSWRFRIWELLKWFKNLIRHARYDILQIELFSPLRSLILRVLLHLFTRRSVLVIHDLSWIHHFNIIQYVLITLNFYLYDLIVFVSKDIERLYSKLFGRVLKGKTAVVPSGVPLEAFSEVKEDRALVREKWGLPKDAFIVVFFGPLHAPFNREACAYIYHISIL